MDNWEYVYRWYQINALIGMYILKLQLTSLHIENSEIAVNYNTI